MLSTVLLESTSLGRAANSSWAFCSRLISRALSREKMPVGQRIDGFQVLALLLPVHLPRRRIAFLSYVLALLVSGLVEPVQEH